MAFFDSEIDVDKFIMASFTGMVVFLIFDIYEVITDNHTAIELPNKMKVINHHVGQLFNAIFT